MNEPRRPIDLEALARPTESHTVPAPRRRWLWVLLPLLLVLGFIFVFLDAARDLFTETTVVSVIRPRAGTESEREGPEGRRQKDPCHAEGAHGIRRLAAAAQAAAAPYSCSRRRFISPQLPKQPAPSLYQCFSDFAAENKIIQILYRFTPPVPSGDQGRG